MSNRVGLCVVRPPRSGHLPHGRFGHACAILGERLVVSQPGKSSKVSRAGFQEDGQGGWHLPRIERTRFLAFRPRDMRKPEE